MRLDSLLLALAVPICAMGYVLSFLLGMKGCDSRRCDTIVGRVVVSSAAAHVVLLVSCLVIWLWWPGDRRLRARLLAVVVAVALAVIVTGNVVVTTL